MNTGTKIAIAAVASAIVIGGGIAACSYDGDDRVQVVQYGYYGPGHVWVLYPTAHVVWVSPSTYKSDTKMYSKPSEVNTYKKTHTVVTESKTTKYNKDGSVTTTTTKNTTKNSTTTTNKSNGVNMNKSNSSSSKKK